MCRVSFLITVTVLILTSVLNFRIIVSGTYLLHFSGRNSKFVIQMHLGIAECRVLFLGHCDLDLCSHY